MNFFKTFFKQLRNAVNFKLLYSVRSANETHSSIFTSFQQADVIVWALVSEFHLYVSCSFFLCRRYVSIFPFPLSQAALKPSWNFLLLFCKLKLISRNLQSQPPQYCLFLLQVGVKGKITLRCAEMYFMPLLKCKQLIWIFVFVNFCVCKQQQICNFLHIYQKQAACNAQLDSV